MNIAQTIPALDLQGLKSALQNGVAKFAFVKKDGTLRFALGTLKLDLIPNSDHPKGVRPASEKVVTFFDLEKTSWRSVSINSLVFGN